MIRILDKTHKHTHFDNIDTLAITGVLSLNNYFKTPCACKNFNKYQLGSKVKQCLLLKVNAAVVPMSVGDTVKMHHN